MVTIGGIDRTKTETFEKTQPSTNFTHHENYDNTWLFNDIAVIKMPNPFELSTPKDKNILVISWMRDILQMITSTWCCCHRRPMRAKLTTTKSSRLVAMEWQPIVSINRHQQYFIQLSCVTRPKHLIHIFREPSQPYFDVCRSQSASTRGMRQCLRNKYRAEYYYLYSSRP